MKRTSLFLVVCSVLASLASLRAYIAHLNDGAASQLELLSELSWRWAGEERFGGLSGLEISEDGTKLIAVSDRPMLVFAKVRRQGDSIVGIQNMEIVRPRTPGSMNYHDEVNSDLEALALEKNGRLWVSTENYHDVEYFNPGEYTANHIDYETETQAFRSLPYNQGLEALSLDPQGRVIAIPETWPENSFPILRLEKGEWSVSGEIRKSGSYVPVGADTGPDGHLYLLERRFVWGIGFSNRVRRFAFVEDRIVETDILLQTKIRTHGNLEGIAVWSDASNAIRLTMVSDDNFRTFLDTEIVEYRWNELRR
ncbi:esterase-like activity of phytase family protein [uncultured Ruegeria sp.]|uniref:esterase-like activity of phytase family protein n=1 Tax=uncultured Ruegeria sp. TaxID=259304 RepID=UPI00261BB8EE|nr:esterase-like activity of phytase family protein [uncultured Ruegeria sp.]